MYRIVFYCPDTHLTYDIRTLEERGVGGGVTSRMRMAHALAARGHAVTAFVNCPEERLIEGVEYRRFSRLSQIETDIFIAGTSGGDYDLGPLRGARLEAKLRILMAHGIEAPGGMDGLPFDFVYAPSNFIRNTAVERWGVPSEKTFVCPRGVVGAYFDKPAQRDLCAIAYAAHPSKGLNEAVAVLRLLRETDSRFTLHVFGGEGLWGVEVPRRGVSAETIEPGVIYHGLVGQRQLARELMACGFSLNLQSREEPFGMVIIESMRAGCIALASPVGAYPEIICHGHNGFLVTGAHADKMTQRQAADLMLELVRRPKYADYVRHNAMRTPRDWDIVARAWEGHWAWARGRTDTQVEGYCRECGGGLLPLADGHHCTGCGTYRRMLWKEQILLKEGGAMSPHEYRTIACVLETKSPCNLLVFGTGNDSKLWVEINKDGKTYFVEDDPVWAAIGVDNVVVVEYGTRVEDWETLLEAEASGALNMDLAPEITDTKWDIILVDAPKGYEPGKPGRMKSIYMAAKLARKGRQVDVLVHDCDRLVEATYADRFLHKDNFIQETERLRHYRLSR